MHLSTPWIRKQSAGMTLLEVLVAISVMGVLIGITAPAVLYARAAGQRVACSNHLRQLGLATQAYHDTWNAYPPWAGLGALTTGVERLFPWIEQPTRSSPSDPPSRIPVLLCPADGWGHESAYGCSYLMSGGPSLPHLSEWNGLANADRLVRIRDISDGASKTAGWSERLRLREGSNDIRRSLFHVSPSTYSERDAARLCRHGPRTLFSLGSNPDPTFAWPSAALVAYSHLLPPNGARCQGTNFELVKFETSASEHRGGVFVAFLDGRVQLISDSIDEGAWFAMGTPAGNEPPF